MKTLKPIAALLCIASMTACSYRLTDFTVISTKNVPLGNRVAALNKADKRVKGIDRAHTVLFIPLGMPNMKEAIDKAIEQYPGAIGLADGVVKSKYWTALLYGQSSYIVEGTPIYEGDLKDASIGNQPAESGMLFFHEVKDGDTLASIAAAYNIKVADLIRWNQLNSTNITAGSRLKIMVK